MVTPQEDNIPFDAFLDEWLVEIKEGDPSTLGACLFNPRLAVKWEAPLEGEERMAIKWEEPAEPKAATIRLMG